jgi:hypothetical protein
MAFLSCATFCIHHIDDFLRGFGGSTSLLKKETHTQHTHAKQQEGRGLANRFAQLFKIIFRAHQKLSEAIGT